MAEDWERAVQEQQREWAQRNEEKIRKVYANNGCLIVFAVVIISILGSTAIASLIMR